MTNRRDRAPQPLHRRFGQPHRTKPPTPNPRPVRRSLTTRTRRTRCLNCGSVIDAALHVDLMPVKPRSGDVTICMECGHIMAFDGDLGMRPLTDAEMVAVAGDRNIVMAQRRIAEARKFKR